MCTHYRKRVELSGIVPRLCFWRSAEGKCEGLVVGEDDEASALQEVPEVLDGGENG